MGTITRTFANNITTSGVFKPTAFNNASFDNVTSVPEGSLPSGGNMVLLSTQTASASSSISFTSGITNTYKEYVFIFNDIHPSTDSVLFQVNFSIDSGSNYNVTKNSSYFRSYHTEADATALTYIAAYDLQQSTSAQPLAHGVGADNDQSIAGSLHLFNPSDTTYIKHFLSTISNYSENDGSIGSYCEGYGNTTSAINAVQFTMSSGNIDAGTIQMFGIL